MEKGLVQELITEVNNQELNYSEVEELEELIIPSTGGGCGIICPGAVGYGCY